MAALMKFQMNTCKRKCSLGALRSLRQLLHDVDELLRPVARRAYVDAEEFFLGGRGHGERVPLQLRDGRAVEEDVLAHIHLEAVLYQLQLQHLGRPHDDLQGREGSRLSGSARYGAAAGQVRGIEHTLL